MTFLIIAPHKYSYLLTYTSTEGRHKLLDSLRLVELVVTSDLTCVELVSETLACDEHERRCTIRLTTVCQLTSVPRAASVCSSYKQLLL